MKTKPSVDVTLPCCGVSVKVTGRKTKQKERSRNHKCNKCGKFFQVNVFNPQSPIIQEQ